MKKYYVEFKTWAEGKIEVPWPYVQYEETSDYRKRDNLEVVANSEKAFLTFDPVACATFLKENVSAVILGAIIEESHTASIESQISNVFGYIEILGICEITSNNINDIAKRIPGAISL